MARKRRSTRVGKSPAKQIDKNESIANGMSIEREESSGESPDGGDSAAESNNSSLLANNNADGSNNHKKFGKYRFLQRSNSSSQEDISETESYNTQQLLPQDIQQIVVGDVSAEVTISQDCDDDEDDTSRPEEDDNDADPCLGEDEVVYEEVIENTVMSDEEEVSYEHHMENSVDIPFSQEVTVGDGNSCSDSNQFTSFNDNSAVGDIKKTIPDNSASSSVKDSSSVDKNNIISNSSDKKGSEINVFSKIVTETKSEIIPIVENDNFVTKIDTLKNSPREESCDNNKTPIKNHVVESCKSSPSLVVDVLQKSLGRTKSEVRKEKAVRTQNVIEVSDKQDKSDTATIQHLSDPRLAAREAAAEKKKLLEKQSASVIPISVEKEKQSFKPSSKIVLDSNSSVTSNLSVKMDLDPPSSNVDTSEINKNMTKMTVNPNEESNSQTPAAGVKTPVVNASTDIITSLGFESDKPVKVKSRWRRSSELEMGNSSSSNVANSVQNNLDNITNSSGIVTSRKCEVGTLSALPPPQVLQALVKDAEIEARLKSFEPIIINQFLTERSRSKEAKRMVCDCSLTKEEMIRNEKGCGDDCLNRLLMIECGSRCTLGDLCSNKRFQNREYTKCEVIKTAKKGFGLMCLETVPSGHFLMEYVGEVIDPKEFKKRAKEYAKDKNRHYYFMALKADTIIDATHKGNISRFINHSCEPNAETQKWTVNGELRIGFFSKRPISLGDEITFDYQLQRYGKEAQRCYCESRNCRGWIGEDPEKEKERERKEWANRREQRKEKKRKEEKRRDFKEYLNDMDLEEEVEKLFLSGVKNQAHTLTLCRLMVRAEDHKCRSRLLDITKKGDTRCLRLFLDYHGLALLWSWMMDNLLPNKLKLQILETLHALPIQNKTMVKDSKVLSIIEKWVKSKSDSLSIDDRKDRSSTEDENSVSPNGENCVVELKTGEEVPVIPPGEGETNREKKTNEEVPARDQDSTPTEIQADDSKRPQKEEERLVSEKAKKLLQKWSTLKEEFRIPKKQRIEQMKEHEREADMGYNSNSDPRDSQSYDRHRSYDKDGSRFREKDKKKRESPDVDWNAKKIQRAEERNANSMSRMPKAQRRQLFAMKVEEEERQRKQMEEMWQKHQEQCAALGVDPTQTAMFNPQTGFSSYYHPANGTWNPFPPPHPDGANINCEGIEGKPPMGGAMFSTNQPPPNIGMPMNIYQARPMLRPPFMEQGAVPPFPGGGGPPAPVFMEPGQYQGGPGGPYPMYQPAPRPPYQAGPPPFPGGGGPPFPPPQQGPPPILGPPPPIYPPMIPPQQQQNLAPMMCHPPPILPQQQPLQPQAQPQAQPTQAQTQFQPQPQMVPGQLTPPLPHGPPPPPPVVLKLPPKWKSAKDKEGRTYYYHVKTRKSQWQFPVFDPNEASESSSESSESSDIDDSSSDDDEEKIQDDEEEEEQEEEGETGAGGAVVMETENQGGGAGEQTIATQPPVSQKQEVQKDKESTHEVHEPVLKKRREGLVQVAIISPRDDDYYGKGISKSKVRDAKEKILRQKMKLKARARKRHANSTSAKCEADTSSGPKRKIKDMFRINMANVVVSHLNPYRKPDCKVARITSTDDFKHLARKLTHFVMLKELRHCVKVEDLECNDNVKHKARDFIHKYMSKFGATYQRPLED